MCRLVAYIGDELLLSDVIVRFCRKNYCVQKAQEFWASLRGKSIELLKNSFISAFFMLHFPEHVMQFNPS